MINISINRIWCSKRIRNLFYIKFYKFGIVDIYFLGFIITISYIPKEILEMMRIPDKIIN